MSLLTLSLYGRITLQYAYQVSSLCVLPLESLRKRKVPEAICCCGCHGNDVIHFIMQEVCLYRFSLLVLPVQYIIIVCHSFHLFISSSGFNVSLPSPHITSHRPPCLESQSTRGWPTSCWLPLHSRCWSSYKPTSTPSPTTSDSIPRELWPPCLWRRTSILLCLNRERGITV